MVIRLVGTECLDLPRGAREFVVDAATARVARAVARTAETAMAPLLVVGAAEPVQFHRQR
jgi:hypothetical protein